MDIIKKKFDGIFEIICKPFKDQRGFFMRTYDVNIFSKIKYINNIVQENHSLSIKKGTIRGLHFQFPPYTETKIVRAIRGEVMDVYLDLRLKSPTFGQWDSIILSSEKMNAIVIPKGFAHGFCTLTDNVEMLYHHDNFYSAEYESGIIWNDEDINIKWPVKNSIISQRDNSFMTFMDFKNKYKGLKL